MIHNTWLIEYTITAQRVLWYVQHGYTLCDMLHDKCNEDLDPILMAEAWREVTK